MKSSLPFIVILWISIQTLSAQETLVHEWVHGWGVVSNGDFPNNITTDGDGNVITTGRFHNTVDFDPGAGVFNLTGTGFDNVSPYVLKLDSDGNFIWAGAFTSSVDCQTGDIMTDAAGNIYVTGTFNSTVDFDPGAGVFELTSGGTFSNSFVVKLDAGGNFVWAKRLTGSFGQSIGSLVIDAAQNVYVIGSFIGTIDFDPDGSSFPITSFGHRDVFLLKLDIDGNFVWVKRFGGTDFEFGFSISLDVSGNIYASGVFQGTPDFDPGAGIVNVTSAGLRDYYVIKFDNDGDFIWVKTIGSTADEYALLIQTDAAGNIYGTGDCEGTLDLDPGASVSNITGNGFFVLKLDMNGEFEWGKFTNAGLNYTLAVDATGIYSFGAFTGTTDFDPGAGVYNLSSDQANYIRKLNIDGNFVWAAQFYSTSNYGSLAADNSGNIFVTGRFYAPTTDFDPDPCVIVDLADGVMYVQKLTLAAQPPPSCEEPGGSLLVIYNAISPDGNGKNEIFRIENIEILEETMINTVTIYNRWGDVVFDVSDYNNTDRVFKGISNSGKDLPSGIYYYKIEFASGLKTKTGYLSLKH